MRTRKRFSTQPFLVYRIFILFKIKGVSGTEVAGDEVSTPCKILNFLLFGFFLVTHLFNLYDEGR